MARLHWRATREWALASTLRVQIAQFRIRSARTAAARATQPAALAQTRAWRPPQTTMAAENEENNEVMLSKLPIAHPDSPSAATAAAAKPPPPPSRLSACLPAHHLAACPPFLLPQPQKPQTREAGETAAAMDKVTDLVRQKRRTANQAE